MLKCVFIKVICKASRCGGAVLEAPSLWALPESSSFRVDPESFVSARLSASHTPGLPHSLPPQPLGTQRLRLGLSPATPPLLTAACLGSPAADRWDTSWSLRPPLAMRLIISVATLFFLAMLLVSSCSSFSLPFPLLPSHSCCLAQAPVLCFSPLAGVRPLLQAKPPACFRRL